MSLVSLIDYIHLEGQVKEKNPRLSGSVEKGWWLMGNVCS